MKWYEKMIERAKKILQEGDPLEPVLFLKKGDKFDVASLMAFAFNKDAMLDELRKRVQAADPDEYLFINEAIIRTIDTKDGGDIALGLLLTNGTLQVGQLPSSTECIGILYGDRKSEKVGTVVFERRGKSIEFKPLQWSSDEELRGRGTHLRR